MHCIKADFYQSLLASRQISADLIKNFGLILLSDDYLLRKSL